MILLGKYEIMIVFGGQVSRIAQEQESVAHRRSYDSNAVISQPRSKGLTTRGGKMRESTNDHECLPLLDLFCVLNRKSFSDTNILTIMP